MKDKQSTRPFLCIDIVHYSLPPKHIKSRRETNASERPLGVRETLMWPLNHSLATRRTRVSLSPTTNFRLEASLVAFLADPKPSLV